MKLYGYKHLLEYYNKRKKEVINSTDALFGINNTRYLPVYDEYFKLQMRIVRTELALEKYKDILDKEVADGTFDLNKDAILTKSFYIDFETFDIIKFDEVVLLYSKLGIGKFMFNNGLNHYVYAISKDREIHVVNNWSTRHMYAEGSEIYDLMIEKCPRALIEKTKENKKILKEKYDIDLDDLNLF